MSGKNLHKHSGRTHSEEEDSSACDDPQSYTDSSRSMLGFTEWVNEDHSFQNHQKLQVSVEVDGAIIATYPLERQFMLVGRSLEADILIQHPSISRFVARIFWESGAWKIMDGGAPYGLAYYGKRLNRREILILVPGDVIWLAGGAVKLHVQEE